MNNHFDPFMGSKLPSELKRPLRRVKTTLLQKGRKLPLGLKTTLLNLQCAMYNQRGQLFFAPPGIYLLSLFILFGRCNCLFHSSIGLFFEDFLESNSRSVFQDFFFSDIRDGYKRFINT